MVSFDFKMLSEVNQWELFVQIMLLSALHVHFKFKCRQCKWSQANTYWQVAADHLKMHIDLPCDFLRSSLLTDDNNCSPSPCQNGGTCEDQVHGFICLCADGYEGTTCETNSDDCSGNPCLNGGTCQDKINGYQCFCASGYTGNSCGIGMCSILHVLHT